MIVDSISALRPAFCRAIIVNVSTREVSTLAVLSALRYSNLPVLVIDLESTDGSWEHFVQLMANEPRLDLCSKSLEKHGNVLDKVFMEARDNTILLIDSDLEIRDPDVVDSMLEAVKDANVFGAGAIHGPTWLGPLHGFPDKVVLYQQRMWIPFTILKVALIKDALREGYSFINRWVPNELPVVPWLAKALSMRFFLPLIKRIQADFLRGTRRTYQNERPNLLCCDTGADMFCHLKYGLGARFIDFGLDSIEKKAHHYHGVTRRRLNQRDHNAAAFEEIIGEVLARLHCEYGVDFDVHAKKASKAAGV